MKTKTKRRLTTTERELMADIELMEEIDFDDDDWERDYIAAVDKANGATI